MLRCRCVIRGILGLVLGLASSALLGAQAQVIAAPDADTVQWQLYLPSLARHALPAAMVRTVILTDADQVARLFGASAEEGELQVWRAALSALAAQPEVAGELLWDLDTQANTAVAAAYHAWTTAEDPTQFNLRANALATALRDWLWDQRNSSWPGLRYVVIAGDDRVLPFYRLRVDPPAQGRLDWTTEAQYFDDNSVAAGSTVGAALAADLTLNDDFYATAQPMPWTDGAKALPVPELAIGRLVERPSDMTAVIDAYLARPRLDARSALLAGNDFMQDGLEAIVPRLSQVIPPASLVRLIGPDWDDGQLKRALFDGRPDLFFFALHATHYRADTPNQNGALKAQDIADNPADLAGKLVVGLACHAGLNVPGPDHRLPMDFPEAWLRHGAMLVASPGWAFGGDRSTPELRYQERLTAQFAERLLADGGTTVGDALVQAKRDYLATLTEQTAWHAKTIGGTVLFGLPMYEVAVGLAHVPKGPIGPATVPMRVSKTARDSGGLR